MAWGANASACYLLKSGTMPSLNWRFTDVYGMDTEFTRSNAKGSKEDAQAEIAPGEVCGDLPPGFQPAEYATKPFHISHWIHDHDKIDLGERILEVISIPGHTPDSIALLEEKNGLLFTGDTFYAGPIWLFRPETDLDAYVASVKKLANLAPSLQLLLPAHNEPVAEPSILSAPTCRWWLSRWCWPWRWARTCGAPP